MRAEKNSEDPSPKVSAFSTPVTTDRDQALPAASLEALARSALERLARSRATSNRPGGQVSGTQLGAFVARLLSADATGAIETVRRLERDGASYTRIADTLLADAARQLGQRWENDTLSFYDVSVAISTLCRVNAVVRRAALAMPGGDGASALFVTLPWQAHTLGIILAAEAFRQHGWDVHLKLETDPDTVLELVSSTTFTLVGFTAGRADSLGDIAALIERLKATRRAPRVLLGGIASNRSEEVARSTGADLIVASIEDSLERAAELRGSARSVD
jgi:methanogenic corrinoid protein MtbC1